MNNRSPWPIYAIAGIMAGFAFAITGLFTDHGDRVVALVVGAVFAVMGIFLPRLRPTCSGADAKGSTDVDSAAATGCDGSPR